MPRRSAADAALTRIALLDSARLCFVADGYAATTTQAIAARAGCSQSALFHHFADKTEIFEQVVAEAVKQYDLGVREAAIAATGGPLGGFLAGCQRSLQLASDPAWSRLVAVDAPAVLGPDRLHYIDADLGLTTTGYGLRLLVRAGVLAADTDTAALALVVYGALTSAAFEFARTSAEPITGPAPGRPDVDRVMRVIERLIEAHRNTPSDA